MTNNLRLTPYALQLKHAQRARLTTARESVRSAFTLIELSVVVAIIAMIMVALLGASKLTSVARLDAARTLTLLSPVPKIKGLQLWLETTSLRSFAAASAVNGTSIATWYDINPNNARANIHNATASGGAMPTYTTNAMNGLPALKFDGSSDYLTVISTGVYAAKFTMFLVAKVNPASEAYLIQGGPSSGSFSESFSVQSGVEGSGFDFNPGGGCGMTIANTGNAEQSRIITEVLTVNIGTNKVLQAYLDGGNSTSGTFTCGGSSSFDLTSLYIGYDHADSEYFFDNYIGEIIIYDRALNDSEIDRVEQYLSKKWKITVS